MAAIDQSEVSERSHITDFMPLTILTMSAGTLTVSEVAAELACSEPTVRRGIRTGQRPAGGSAHGSGVRIRRAGLEAWLYPNRARRTTDAVSG